jgi:hypothetical protein
MSRTDAKMTGHLRLTPGDLTQLPGKLAVTSRHQANIPNELSNISQELRLFSWSVFNFGRQLSWRRPKPRKLALHLSSLGSQLAKMARELASFALHLA